jgi:peptide chain release factor 1
MTETRDLLLERARDVVDRREELAHRMADPDLLADSDRLREVAREHSDLEEPAEAAEAYLALLDQLAQAEELASGGEEAELEELAAAEAADLRERRERMEARLKRLLVPSDPLDDRPAVLEIRAGTGGDEAALFAGDLYRMYTRYASRKGWKLEGVSFNEGSAGGFKEAIVVVRGRNAYGRLRYESGVHRVQRVPETETGGRIHTSAATVAVLPEAEDVDVEIDPSELKIDVFRSSGPGGQSVNTTDSAVRITHEPTGLVVTCQDEKSQHKNRSKAMRVLRSRLLDRKLAEQEARRARERRSQVGTGDRSAKIRTYNFPQSRVTDHRIDFTTHALDAILDGELVEVIEALRVAGMEERLEAAVR